MGHKRVELRARCKELLTTATAPIMKLDITPRLEVGDTNTEIPVFTNRASNLKASELPCITVYTPSEKIERDLSSSPVVALRKCQLVVEATTRYEDDDACDNLADAIEDRLIYVVDSFEAVSEYAQWGLNYVNKVYIAGTESGLLAEGETPKYGVAVTFIVEYVTDEPTHIVERDMTLVDITTYDTTTEGANKQDIITYD